MRIEKGQVVGEQTGQTTAGDLDPGRILSWPKDYIAGSWPASRRGWLEPPALVGIKPVGRKAWPDSSPQRCPHPASRG